MGLEKYSILLIYVLHHHTVIYFLNLQGEQICDISEEAQSSVRNFRFKKNNVNCALILKIDREKKLVIVDDELEDVSLEELQV
jgi:hypothetical protein